MRLAAALLLLLPLIGPAVQTQGNQLEQIPQAGVSLISPNDGDWNWQIELLAQMSPEVVKVHVPEGFVTTPFHVWQMIQVVRPQTVILRTEDCDPSYDEVRYSLYDRGFVDLVEDNPEIDWWVEIGNEPDFCGMDPITYRNMALGTVQGMREDFPGFDVRYMLSMPTKIEQVRDIFLDHRVERDFDAIGTHLYGHYGVWDGGSGDWVKIYEYLIEHTNLPIWITEAGINDPDTFPSVKAIAYVRLLGQLDARVQGVVFWVIAEERFPNYQLNEGAMKVLAQRLVQPGEGWQYFHETDQYVSGQFHEYYRGAGLDLGDEEISLRESIALFGYPLTPPYRNHDNGLIEQVFERAVFELHPENDPPYHVLLKRLGAEYAVSP